jgi:Na+-translocating ferredoxin:NAD+ oxidoreductase subunit B
MIIVAVLTLGMLGIVFGIILGIIAKKFSKKENPLVEKIYAILPGLDCGACSFPGCKQYAESCVQTKNIDFHCGPGGEKVMDKISKILGITVEESEKLIPRIKCNGGGNAQNAFMYQGVETCHGVRTVANLKSCPIGCSGFGDCTIACKFNALSLKDGLPVVNYDNCIRCGACARACPNDLIEMTPESHSVYIKCKSHDPGRKKAKYCKTSCITCSLCVRECPKQAIEIVDNLPVIDYEKCIRCGICVTKCPRKIIFNDDLRKNDL